MDLPLNGRSSAALALLAPGVRQAYALPKRESSFNVNGLRSQFNNFILDGLDNNAYGASNQGLSNQVIQVSPDVLQEFKVITDNYSAALRSGSNQLHGTVWDFLRNTDLNAVGFFKPTGARSLSISRTSSAGPRVARSKKTKCSFSAITRAGGVCSGRFRFRASLPMRNATETSACRF